MKVLPVVFLFLSIPFLTLAQRHEIKVGFADLSFEQKNYNLGYEYLFSKPLGLQLQTGYSTESFVQSYGFTIKQGDDRQDWRALGIRETLSREQIYFTVKGKYYVFETPKSDLFFTSIFLSSDLLLNQKTENTTTLETYNYPRQVLSITPSSTLFSGRQPAPQSRLNMGLTFGSKFFLLKDQLFLEPELGWQLNLLQLRDARILAALNLGYCLK